MGTLRYRGHPYPAGPHTNPSQEHTMPWWQWLLAVTGVGMGPLVLGFLAWAWWRTTRPEPDE